MDEHGRERAALCGGIILTVALAASCGGGGGGGGSSGGQSSTIQGNMASAPSASLQHERVRWLAWASEQFIGLARRAFAQSSSDLAGVQVSASGANGSPATDMSDDQGAFALPGSPTGNVTVVFSRGRCQGEVVLPDMTKDAVVTLDDVAFDCTGAHPAKVAETFQGVIRNVPGSPNGNLNVCVASGGAERTRVVKLQDTAIQDANGTPTSFNNLEKGQLIEADGEREGLGTSSTLDADIVKILSAGHADDCAAAETPTPEATETPEPTATPMS
jgi:hypothetical protein